MCMDGRCLHDTLVAFQPMFTGYEGVLMPAMLTLPC